MDEAKVRIVGPEHLCLKILNALKERFHCEHRLYHSAPIRYTRTPKADTSIYLTVKEPQTK